MKNYTLRIATRKSPLALWQTRHVRHKLQTIHPILSVELIEIKTKGDKILDAPLAKIGGKGLFVKELEHALLSKRADIAVHSMKDVPIEFPEGLTLSIIMARENPYDAFVSNNYNDLESLPSNAIVGTSSLRRQCQLLAVRPDLEIRTLRGNVGTRLSKLDKGEFDAIILASAGLKRLDLEKRIRRILPADILLPAIGQGAIGIECRSDDEQTQELITQLNDFTTFSCVKAERAINATLGGGCQVPIAGFAEISGKILTVRGLVGNPDGSEVLRSQKTGAVAEAEILGRKLAENLLNQGADQILSAINT